MRWLILSVVMGVLSLRPVVADEKPSPPPPPAPGVDEAPVRRTAARVAAVTEPQFRGVEFELALIHLSASAAEGAFEIPSTGAECLAATSAWRDAGILEQQTTASVQSLVGQVARIHIGQTVMVPTGVQMVMSRDRSPRTEPRYSAEQVGLIFVCTASQGEGDRILVETSIEETRFRKPPVSNDLAEVDSGSVPIDKDSTMVNTTIAGNDGECQLIGRFQSVEREGRSRIVLVLLTPRWIGSGTGETLSR